MLSQLRKSETGDRQPDVKVYYTHLAGVPEEYRILIIPDDQSPKHDTMIVVCGISKD